MSLKTSLPSSDLVALPVSFDIGEGQSPSPVHNNVYIDNCQIYSGGEYTLSPGLKHANMTSSRENSQVCLEMLRLWYYTADQSIQ